MYVFMVANQLIELDRTGWSPTDYKELADSCYPLIVNILGLFSDILMNNSLGPSC